MYLTNKSQEIDIVDLGIYDAYYLENDCAIETILTDEEENTAIYISYVTYKDGALEYRK